MNDPKIKKWLCMMYPQLKLLQKLLADDGVIFISIDDNDPRGAWRNIVASAPNAATHQGMVYAIQNPLTGELAYPPQGRL